MVKTLAETLPITLITAPMRKGYSRAVVDGLRATTADLVACVDADGQCDPRDLVRLVQALDGHDLVVGRRTHRADHWSRMLMSRAFRTVFSAFFSVPLHDPSSPYLLITRAGLDRVLASDPGILPQGFWWEFYARAAELGLDLAEIPVGHRTRSAGRTQVYRPTKIPRIALVHLIGLVRLRRQLRSRRP